MRRATNLAVPVRVLGQARKPAVGFGMDVALSIHIVLADKRAGLLLELLNQLLHHLVDGLVSEGLAGALQQEAHRVGLLARFQPVALVHVEHVEAVQQLLLGFLRNAA